MGPSTWRRRPAPASRTPWWPSWCRGCRGERRSCPVPSGRGWLQNWGREGVLPSRNRLRVTRVHLDSPGRAQSALWLWHWSPKHWMTSGGWGSLWAFQMQPRAQPEGCSPEPSVCNSLFGFVL